jgi:hypothetical protein
MMRLVDAQRRGKEVHYRLGEFVSAKSNGGKTLELQCGEGTIRIKLPA